MSTTEVAPNIVQPITRENYVLARVFEGEGENVKLSIVPEDQAREQEKKYNEAVAKGEPVTKVVFEYQAFSIPSAGTVDGMAELVPDESERVLLFNRGLSTKLQNKARSIMRSSEDGELTFAVTEDAYDMTEHAAAPTSRRGLSTLEKTLNVAKDLPPDQKAQLIAALTALLNS